MRSCDAAGVQPKPGPDAIFAFLAPRRWKVSARSPLRGDGTHRDRAETLGRVVLEAPGSGSVKIRAVLRQRGKTVHGSRVIEDAQAAELSE